MKTILVVDDLFAVQQFLRETLESKGYETLGAANGNKAYDLLANHSQRINLVITDYNISETSGLDLLKKTKENPDLKKIPFIFLTSESNPEIINSAAHLGFNSWIKKPYRSDLLISEIERALKVGA